MEAATFLHSLPLPKPYLSSTPYPSLSADAVMSIPDLNPLPSPPLLPPPNDQQEDSDGDLFTVPEVEKKVVPEVAGGQWVRKGRNAADREYRKLKRLLRNRVSAQEARERKKIYVTDLESRAKDLEDKNSHLEEKISTLINENTMLRKVLMNRRPKVDDESSDPQND